MVAKRLKISRANNANAYYIIMKRGVYLIKMFQSHKQPAMLFSALVPSVMLKTLVILAIRFYPCNNNFSLNLQQNLETTEEDAPIFSIIT